MDWLVREIEGLLILEQILFTLDDEVDILFAQEAADVGVDGLDEADAAALAKELAKEAAVLAFADSAFNVGD